MSGARAVERTQSPRGTKITPGTSPRTKEEKRKSRKSMQEIREQTASELSETFKTPNIEDFLKLTPKQEDKLAKGDLQLKDLTGKQKSQYRHFERKVTERIAELPGPGSDRSTTPRKEAVHAESVSTPRGDASPRVKSRRGVPRAKPEQMEVLKTVLHDPLESQWKLLGRKLKIQGREIGGLEQQLEGLQRQLTAAKERQSLLQRKQDGVAEDLRLRSLAARQPDTRYEGVEESSSADASAVIDQLARSERHVHQ
jgi:hypothetical protein